MSEFHYKFVPAFDTSMCFSPTPRLTAHWNGEMDNTSIYVIDNYEVHFGRYRKDPNGIYYSLASTKAVRDGELCPIAGNV